MNSFFEQVNSIGLLEFKPILRISEMEINKNYVIVNIESGTHPQFGRNVYVETDDVRIYLPKRISEKMTDEDIDKINKSTKKYALVFIGQKNVSKGSDANLVKFIEL